MSFALVCGVHTGIALNLLTFNAGSLTGLGSQATARQGNALGILGVSSGILASLAAVGFPPAVLVQFAGVASIGGLIGTLIGRRITATELPQMVAMLHSVVGLAAVMTSIASVMADIDHASLLHLVTAYLGLVIGKRILTVSFVCDPVCARWHYLHWFYRCFPQARGTDVIQTTCSSHEAFR